MGDSVFVDSFLRDLIPQFLEYRKKDLDLINRLIEEEKFDEMVAVSHRLRGTSLNYGFVHLAEISLMLEKGALQKNASNAKQAISEMQRHLGSMDIHFVTEH